MGCRAAPSMTCPTSSGPSPCLQRSSRPSTVNVPRCEHLRCHGGLATLEAADERLELVDGCALKTRIANDGTFDGDTRLGANFRRCGCGSHHGCHLVVLEEHAEHRLAGDACLDRMTDTCGSIDGRRGADETLRSAPLCFSGYGRSSVIQPVVDRGHEDTIGRVALADRPRDHVQRGLGRVGVRMPRAFVVPHERTLHRCVTLTT